MQSNHKKSKAKPEREMMRHEGICLILKVLTFQGAQRLYSFIFFLNFN